MKTVKPEICTDRSRLLAEGRALETVVRFPGCTALLSGINMSDYGGSNADQWITDITLIIDSKYLRPVGRSLFNDLKTSVFKKIIRLTGVGQTKSPGEI